MGQNIFLIFSLYNLTLQYCSQKNKHLVSPHYSPSVWYDFSCPWNIYTHNVYKHIEVKCIYIIFSKKKEFVNHNLLRIYHRNMWEEGGKSNFLPLEGCFHVLHTPLFESVQNEGKWLLNQALMCGENHHFSLQEKEG